MKLNPILKRDINAIVNNDCKQFMSPRTKAMTPQQREHFLDDCAKELRETFDTYGVPYTEDTVKAAMVALIQSTSATQQMFLHTNPVAPENNHPMGIALHGGLTAIYVMNHVIENFEEE